MAALVRRPGAKTSSDSLPLILLIDNFDSFTFNLLHALQSQGADVLVRRNNAIELSEIDALNPAALVISPGPGTPERAGISVRAIARSIGVRPILGVCLGHQALGVALGGSLRRARELVHGKTTPVNHCGTGLFAGLNSPMTVARYHSLILDPATLPQALEITATTPDGDIMAVRHRSLQAEGVQFHPESFLTPEGTRLLSNFLDSIKNRAGAGSPT